MASVLISPPTDLSETAQAVEDHVHHLLQSPQFLRAETQRKLLTYLWEHRHKSVSEYAIATEGLGRNHHFDSTSDASVRVHISRLRRKLKDYYAETGETELIVIPTGTHQLIVLDPAPVADAQNFVPVIVEEPQVSMAWLRRHAVSVLGVLCGLLLMALCGTAVLLVRQRAATRAAGREIAQPNAFWRSFLAGDAPVKIVLPTPVFFNFSNHPWLKFRSTAVNNFDDIKRDPVFNAIADKLGPSGLEQSYTVTWDTLAAIEIARYLDRTGQGKRVSFEVTRDSSLISLEQANVIVLGTYATLQPMRAYTDTLNFTLSRGEERVFNAKPQADEPKEFMAHDQGKDRHIEPSIIALLPGRANGLKVLMLESRDTSGMISLLLFRRR